MKPTYFSLNCTCAKNLVFMKDLHHAPLYLFIYIYISYNSHIFIFLIINICYRVTPKWQLEDLAEKGEWFILQLWGFSWTFFFFFSDELFSQFARIVAMVRARGKGGWVRWRRRRSTPTSTAPGCAPPSSLRSKGRRRGKRRTSTRRLDNILLNRALHLVQIQQKMFDSHHQLSEVICSCTGYNLHRASEFWWIEWTLNIYSVKSLYDTFILHIFSEDQKDFQTKHNWNLRWYLSQALR